MAFNSQKLLRTIAKNVVQTRRALKWSQQELADRSTVSVRMVGLIEAGDNNVSLATLGNLAGALNLTFSQLVEEAPSPSGPAGGQPRRGVRLWEGSHKGTKVDLLQSFPASHLMELWKWTIAPGDRYRGEPDLPGFHEVVYVLRGELTLEQEDGRQVLRAGDTLGFPSDRPYAFVNSGKTSLTFTLNVVG
jgi:transcriptional regulator with XRE-family HTH domain